MCVHAGLGGSKGALESSLKAERAVAIDEFTKTTGMVKNVRGKTVCPPQPDELAGDQKGWDKLCWVNISIQVWRAAM